MAPHMTEGPSTCITVLGIEFDTQAMELRLPTDKLQRLGNLLAQWQGKRACWPTGPVGIAGQSLAARMQGGTPWTHVHSTYLQFVGSDTPFQAALYGSTEWWCTFFSRWNGTSLLRPSRETNPDHEIWSDASGSLGCGAHWRGLWFQAEWKGLSIATATIAAKESSSPSWWRD